MGRLGACLGPLSAFLGPLGTVCSPSVREHNDSHREHNDSKGEHNDFKMVKKRSKNGHKQPIAIKSEKTECLEIENIETIRWENIGSILKIEGIKRKLYRNNTENYIESM